MPREFDDNMHEPLNCCYQDPQARRRSMKTINRREWKDKSYEDLKNYSHHRDFKLQTFPSHDCSFQNSTKQGRKDLKMTAASEQQIDTEMPRKSRRHKSRSPLTHQRIRKQQIQEIPLNPYPHDFETPDFSNYINRCMGKPLDKLPRRKIKEETTQNCPETIAGENEILRVDKRGNKKDRGKLRSQRCLNELEELKEDICQFECEKMAQERNFNDQRKRNPLNPKNCPKLLRQEDSDIDHEEEEANRRLEREIVKIFREPCTHSKRIVKTPETTTSATETSIVEEADGRGQRNVQRETTLDDHKHLQIHDGSASSEATGSENDEEREDTLRASPNLDRDSPDYIEYLRNLRWRYLSLIQVDLNRLYELEQFLETLTSKNSKSGETRHVEKGRPVTRAPALR